MYTYMYIKTQPRHMFHIHTHLIHLVHPTPLDPFIHLVPPIHLINLIHLIHLIHRPTQTLYSEPLNHPPCILLCYHYNAELTFTELTFQIIKKCVIKVLVHTTNIKGIYLHWVQYIQFIALVESLKYCFNGN